MSRRPQPPFVKPDRPSAEQLAIWRRMSPAEKLAIADDLRRSALRLHEAWLRRVTPPLSEREIASRMREYVLRGV